MKKLNDEIQQFIAASEHLLASTLNPEHLSKMEQNIIQYYLDALGNKFKPTF